MKTKLLLISLLCIGLLSCETDNKRDNESSNNQENVNGEEGENGSSDENDSSYIKNGALPGVFSVSETKQVKFSQGNLQYQASTSTWRFAEHQYDYIGEDNENISTTYNGWIDLFGWGTGDNPTNTSTDYDDYSTFEDWGVNKISNGGNVSNAWFTLSIGEWKYLLDDRPNASAKQGVAMVNGVNGLVLLPDNWTLPDGAHFTSGFASNNGFEEYKTVNTYTISEWEVMESAGAVFLPAAGNRYGASMSNVGMYGFYWSSTYESSFYANKVCFDSGPFNPAYNGEGRYFGHSVRLCSEFKNNQENVNGSSDENDSSYIKNGALPGVFSVSDTKQVKFSQGNLQYQASTGTWRFAEHQYDYIGEDNENISTTYNGWIDLFGWGTGDNPTNTSTDYDDYSTFVDWGVNKISNGGNVSNAWFTLSKDEWKYLLNDRPNASAKQGVAMVNGVNGLVLLPDDWTLPDGAHFTSGFASNDGYEYYKYYKTVNTYTASEWTLMEEAGAVFLPAAGYRYGASMSNVGMYGGCWSSTYYSSENAYLVNFYSGRLYPSNNDRRDRGRSVRLCSEISSK